MAEERKVNPIMNLLKILTIDEISLIIRSEKHSKKVPLSNYTLEFFEVNPNEEIKSEIQKTVKHSQAKG